MIYQPHLLPLGHTHGLYPLMLQQVLAGTQPEEDK